jgi:5'-nucleotidase
VLTLLVTNDDGVAAPGIGALVDALITLDNVSVVVVAPATNQSGTADQTTAGGVTSSPAVTTGGVEALAVEGFPADSVLVALDEQGVSPDLVFSGINDGQNVGPLVNVSGTVGAARTAARRGFPAVAVSQGLGSPADFPTGVEVALNWFAEHRGEVESGTLGTDTITSINVPTCTAGELRGTLDVPLATDFGTANPLGPQDCTSTLMDPADDAEAFFNGFAAVTAVPLQ